MEMEQIRSIAESQNIETGTRSKVELIKSIQTSEGNFDCFATAYAGECDQQGCSWREDCFEAARGGEPS